MYALGPSGLFWFGLNLAALNCIELIVVENGKRAATPVYRHRFESQITMA